MSDTQKPRSLYTATRRSFLTQTALTTASTAALMASGNYAWAAAADTFRIGLIGCGGRGRGAAVNTCTINEGVEIVALADAFPDRVEQAKNELKQVGNKYKVTDDRCFVGLDAYKKVLALDNVNMVILATPPGFRPIHFAAAVEAGKHIFFEKPVAVDPHGVRMVMEAGKKAEAKKLGVVSGTQRRHQLEYIETIKRIHEGALGDIVAAQLYWNQGPLWHTAREGSMSDTEWQMRNWLYFTWLSGDHYVEQHIHNLDVANWVLNAHPVAAYGTGGRQARVDPAFGHIFDHFGVEYEYDLGNGKTVLTWSMARQQEGTEGRVSERVVGTKGVADPSGSIRGENKFRYEGPKPNPYELEHKDLVESIRNGNPLNEAQRVAESTLTAIMGRMSAYSGKRITWDQAMASQERWVPENLDMKGNLPVPPVAIPGKYEVK